MAYIPDSGSVAAWLQSDNASVISVGQGSVAVAIVSGSIAASFTPPANQSVSGTIGASIIGLPPVAVTNTPSISGTVLISTAQGAVELLGSGADDVNNATNEMVTAGMGYVWNGGTWDRLRGNSSVGALVTTGTGSVISYVQNSVAVAIVSGSIAASFTPPANQSVSGTVQAQIQASVGAVIIGGSIAVAAGSQYLENAITPSVTGTAVMFKSNISSSIMSVVTPATPLPVSVQGTVTALQGTTPWLTNQGGSVITVFQDSSLITTLKSSSIIAVATGSVVAIPSGSTISYVQNSVATVIIGGSVAAGTQYLENQIIPSVTGTAVMFKSNISSSIMSVVTPQTPLPVSVQGVVTALQGTTPWLTNQGGSVITVWKDSSVVTVNQSSSIIAVATGSVVALQGGTTITSIAGILENTIQASTTGIPVFFKSDTSASVMSVVTPSTPLPVRGSVSGTVNLGLGTTTIGSVVLAGGGAIIGSVVLAGGVNALGSVATLQGTNPWITLNTGSVITVFQDSSIIATFKSSSVIAVVTGSVAAVGSTIAYIQNSVAAVIIGGSITATVGTQYLENQKIPSVTGTAVMFKSNMDTSIMTVVTPATPLPVSVQGTVTALQGTTPWLTNQGGSVIAVFQSSSVIGVVTGSVVTLPGNTSTITISTGSIITIQQANSIVGTYAEDAASGGGDKGVAILGVRNDTMASLVSADLDYTQMALDSAGRTIIKPFIADDIATRISFTGSTVSTSVLLIQASAVGKRNYVTDFWIANTGATTTLITFKDGSTSILGYTIAPAGGGSNAPGIAVPFRTAPSQDLTVVPTSASSIIYYTVQGYQAP